MISFFLYRCFSYRLTVILPPLPKVQCPNFFFIFGILGENNWKEVVSYLKTFAHEGCKIAAAKKSFFYNFFFFFQIFSSFFLFKRLFAPISWSPMSKLFIFSESFGKSNEKNLSQIWKLLLMKSVRPSRKKVCFLTNFFSSRFFLWLVLLSALGKICFVSSMLDFFGYCIVAKLYLL